MKTTFLTTIILLLLFSKVFIAIWVYKDAKLRGIDPAIWAFLILFFSGSLIFLLYVLVIRKEENIVCENCNFSQSASLSYCGRCGNKMEINRYKELDQGYGNRIFLVIGILLLILSLVLVIVFTYKAINEDIDNLPISIMSVSNKYNGKWKESFKYKNGEGTHKFKIKDKTTLNCSWEINKGNIEVKLYDGDNEIKKINSTTNPNYNELIDLREYSGNTIILKLKANKASGKIDFFLE